MRIARGWFSAIAVLLFLMATGSVAYGQAQHVRWDIIHLTNATTCPTVNPGPEGHASAKDNQLSVDTIADNNGNTLTLTGTGTFVAPAGGGGTSGAVTGGGTWKTFAPDGTTLTGSGTYSVTGLVRWEEAPGTFPACADNIGNPSDFRAGLAVLRIEYSPDGSHGILVLSCHGAGTPDTVFEGITASKDFVDYWHRQAPGPATGPNANRTAFHIE